MPSRIPEAEEREIVGLYEREWSAREIGEHLGRAESTVLDALKRQGVVTRRGRKRALTTEQEREAVDLYVRQGYTIEQIVASLGGTYGSVHRALTTAGVEFRIAGVTARTFSNVEIKECVAHWENGLKLDEIVLRVGFGPLLVKRALAQAGITDLRPVERHPNWKGGRQLTSEGYVLVRVAADDPMMVMANRRGYVPEHRLVMARALGRPLTADETVHHIDGDRQHNDQSNLQLRIGSHNKGVAFRCRACGSHNVEPVALG
jgi:hypothetical protein